ncbi:Actin-histidine N-methyltransferase (Endothelial differentiation inhibitory protein D10) (Protein-L-histidine N-tele-methyltransferase) (SET domain-containing protein 3) [Durusdinium trenchii]|uniref:Actin-histidine N-methyltransferase (Endothelial differentiation inhibitory protein D10) (Protein-L-histidine N-tele-methyltransferase) (SET domain-containing protein 3) n=1 Tax=Durusdinium trenchii TaxID=1381693 RepID=A0ABP0HF99_9DINO
MEAGEVASNFQKWCHEQGCQMEKIKVTKTCRGFGLETTAALKAGEVALSIPLDLCLTLAASARSRIGQHLLASDTVRGQRISAQALMYVVMIDGWHDPSSKWHAYLRQIPSRHGDPLWWTMPQREERLAGTQLLYEVQRHERQLEAVYASLFPALSQEQPEIFPKERFTWKAFCWARSSLSSRCFALEHLEKFMSQSEQKEHQASAELNSQLEPNEARIVECVQPNLYLSPHEQERLALDFPGVLCPLLDTANHDPSVLVDVGLCNSKGELHLGVSQRSAVDAGQEYFINYGNHRSNLQLLLGHGFCVPENPQDTLPLKLGQQPTVHESKIRQEAHKMAGLDLDQVFELSVKTPMPEPLLATIRLVVLPINKIYKMMQSGDLREQLLRPIECQLDPHAEVETFCVLRRELLKKQRALPANTSSWQGSLPSCPGFDDWCEYYASLYRVGQQDIIRAALCDAFVREQAAMDKREAYILQEEEEEEEQVDDDEVLEDKELPAKKRDDGGERRAPTRMPISDAAPVCPCAVAFYGKEDPAVQGRSAGKPGFMLSCEG